MTLIFIIFLILLLVNSKIHIKENNKEYISKKQTTIINGMFVVLVFYSHFLSYVNEINEIDKYLKFIINNVGQLMVTTFLFYSGYGIYESIKKNKEYRKNFIKNRLIPIFNNFSIAIILFIIMNLLIGNDLNIIKTLLSFTAWESIGNSNWYMFAIFSEYIFLIISFKLLKKDNHQIFLVLILSIIYILVLKIFKERHWYDTILCFPFGMYFSYYKTKIEKYILNKKKYWLILTTNILLFIILFLLKRYINSIILYNVLSILFVTLITLFGIKIKFNSIVFEYIGKRVFWIYILQRIPMIILKDKLNYQLYFLLSLIITVILSEILYNLTNKLNNYTKSKLEKKIYL